MDGLLARPRTQVHAVGGDVQPSEEAADGRRRRECPRPWLLLVGSNALIPFNYMQVSVGEDHEFKKVREYDFVADQTIQQSTANPLLKVPTPDLPLTYP